MQLTVCGQASNMPLLAPPLRRVYDARSWTDARLTHRRNEEMERKTRDISELNHKLQQLIAVRGEEEPLGAPPLRMSAST